MIGLINIKTNHYKSTGVSEKSNCELKMIDEKKKEKCLDKEFLDGKSYGVGIRHLQMVSMGLTMIALFMARGSMGVAVLAMSDVNKKNDTSITIYDWDKRTQSLILSSFFWGYVIMQLPAGIIARKFGGKPIIFVSLLANGTICLLIPTLASLGGWTLVCASRVVMGLTQACLFPGSHTLLGQWLPPKEQTSYSGVVYGGVQIGTILTLPISGFLSETALGWKMIFYTMSGVLYATAVFWYFFAASSPRCHRLISEEERSYIESGLNSAGSKKNVKTPWKAILKTKALWAVLVPHVGYAMGFVLFFVDMPTYLEKGLQISLKNSAILSALPYLGMWLGSMIASIVAEKMINSGWCSKTFARKLFSSIAMFGMAAGLISLSFMGPENRTLAVATLITTLTVSGAAMAGHTINQLDISPNFAGVMMGFTNFIANIGSLAVPIITGLILGKDSIDTGRWQIVFLLHAGLNIATNIVFMIFGSSERQDWDDPDYMDKTKADPEETKPVLSNRDKEAETNKHTS
ncbi:putative inorganic phosphate cotransporter [Amyelois transitella]|uniref:putative inorganic phosphate cotransporter n=1 Tax=Amyelois transitella TaxID=680683 RepID=UPI00298FB1E8|nr:putative inorganic phosphate cotransporter [Amyelois transitella]